MSPQGPGGRSEVILMKLLCLVGLSVMEPVQTVCRASFIWSQYAGCCQHMHTTHHGVSCCACACCLLHLFSVGINLVSARRLVLYDLLWNPVHNKQVCKAGPGGGGKVDGGCVWCCARPGRMC